MSIIRTIIVDDEPLACRRIHRMVKEDPDIHIVAICNDANSAIEAIRLHVPELVFLDIQMPDMNGFEILDKLDPENPPAVIFVTAYDQFALQAFDIHAADYLLKPVELKRLRKAIARAKMRIRSHDQHQTNKEILKMLAAMQNDKYLDRVAVKDQSKVFLIKVRQIEWIESEGKYLNLHCGKQSYLIRRSLSDMEAHLDPSKFLRIHKQTIINIDYIRELQPWFHGDYRVVLASGQELALSRRFRHRFKHYLGPSANE